MPAFLHVQVPHRTENLRRWIWQKWLCPVTPAARVANAAMNLHLPAYNPPNAERANVAVALGPILVLLTFALIVARLIDPDTGLAVFAASTVWVVYEMSVYQKTVDGYNLGYVDSHLRWRSGETLAAVVDDAGIDAPTRDFVRRFLAAGRVLLLDGQSG